MDRSIGVILFARMSSRRLPGKMLRPFGPGTLFERVVARARCLGRPLLLATSTDPSDDSLCAASETLGVPVFRGSLDDVLGRACEAARHAGFEAFARLCGDRPFLPLEDMRAGLDVMASALETGRCLDLVTTHLPRPVPPGLLTEIIRTESLERVRELTDIPAHREHVTLWFYANPDASVIHALTSPLQDLHDLHMSVDTAEDLSRLGQLTQICPELKVPTIAAAVHLRQMLDTEPSA